MLGQLFRRNDSTLTEHRVIQPFGPWGNTGSLSAAGVSVSSGSATQLLAVHGCVALISDTIATLPLCVYRDTANGSHEEISTVSRWLKRPNPNVTFIEFVSQTLVSLLLEGNAYWVYSVDGNGLPNELHVLDPSVVTVKPASDDVTAEAQYSIGGVVYRGNIVHIKGIVRPGALTGISPVEDARQSIGLGLAAQEFASRFYSNGASLSGVIETDRDLTLDQARETVRKFAGDHAGLRNAHRPGLLDNGAQWKPLSVTPEQAQFLQSRQFQTAEIASQMFLLDPAWFAMSPPGGQGLTYQNRAQLGEHLAQFTLARWMIRLEKAISDLLPQPQYAKFNLDALKRGDLAARATYYTAALNPQTGWLVKDEVRELEDLGPMPAQPAPPVPVPPPLVAPVQMNSREERAATVVTAPPMQFELTLPEIHFAPPEINVDVRQPNMPEIVIPATVVNVPPAQIHVETPVQVDAPVTVNPEVRAPDVTVHSAPVLVDAPNVTVAAPNVTVNPEVRAPDVQVDVAAPVVNVPEQSAPVVNVSVPKQRPVQRRIVRDRSGLITGVDEVSVD